MIQKLAERHRESYKSGKTANFKEIKSLPESLKQDAELYKEHLDDLTE